MTKEQYLQKCDELLASAKRYALEKCEEYLAAVAITDLVESSDSASYRPAKIAVTAALKHVSYGYEPRSKDDIATVENLQNF